MQSLDTNIVLRLIMGDIADQQVLAVRLLHNSPGQLQVADIVFVEVEYALRNHYGMTRIHVATLLNGFASLPKINCNRMWLGGVLAAYEHHPALSFTDIALSQYAHLNKAEPLWTFDKKLASQSPQATLLV